MFAENVPFPAAFLAGLLSFFSPCIFPLIPAYFSFITGFSLEELTGKNTRVMRRRVILATLAYVAGFSAIFVLLGASASFLGGLLAKYKDIVRIIGGIIILLLGIHLLEIFRIPLLEIEKKFQVHQKPLHYLGIFFIGMAFGAGWSPCIGPLLGSILVLAGSQETVARGILLLAVYSMGLAIPFILLSFCIHLLITFVNKTRWVLKYVNKAAGILLVLIGLLLITNKLSLLAVSP